MTFFKFLWVVDSLVALVVLYFFFAGLADGSVSSRNMGLWLIILAVIAGIMIGSVWLRNHKHSTLGFVLLLVLAIPALFYLLFILFAIFGNQRWN